MKTRLLATGILTLATACASAPQEEITLEDSLSSLAEDITTLQNELSELPGDPFALSYEQPSKHEEKLTAQFENILEEMAGRMNIKTPTVFVTNYCTNKDIPILAYRAEGSSDVILHVYEPFLKEKKVVLEHGAMHEICHEVLKHEARQWGSSYEQEKEAEACVLQELGMDHAIKAYREFGRDNKELNAMSDEELEQGLTDIYGGTQ